MSFSRTLTTSQLFPVHDKSKLEEEEAYILWETIREEEHVSSSLEKLMVDSEFTCDQADQLLELLRTCCSSMEWIEFAPVHNYDFDHNDNDCTLCPGWYHFVSHLHRVPGLTRLSLWEVETAGACPCPALSNLFGAPQSATSSITQLDLYVTSSSLMKGLPQALQQAPQLRELSIIVMENSSRSTLSNQHASCSFLVQALQPCPDLTHLDIHLTEGTMSDGSMTRLLEQHSQLQRLNIVHNDEEVEACSEDHDTSCHIHTTTTLLVEALVMHPNLMDVSLPFNSHQAKLALGSLLEVMQGAPDSVESRLKSVDFPKLQIEKTPQEGLHVKMTKLESSNAHDSLLYAHTLTLLPQFSPVTKLSLYRIQLPNMYKHLQRLFQSPHCHIQELSFSAASRWQEVAELEHLRASLDGYTKMTRLEIQSCGSLSGVEQLCSSSRLRHVTLTASHHLPWQEAAQVLLQQTHLEHLSVEMPLFQSNPQAQERLFGGFPKALQEHSSLQSLKISSPYASLTNGVWDKLLASVEKTSILQELDLSEARIGNMDRLGLSLSRFPSSIRKLALPPGIKASGVFNLDPLVEGLQVNLSVTDLGEDNDWQQEDGRIVSFLTRNSLLEGIHGLQETLSARTLPTAVLPHVLAKAGSNPGGESTPLFVLLSMGGVSGLEALGGH